MYCSCGNISENKDTGECASCARARRKGEAISKKPVKPFKPIPRVSERQSRYLRIYAQMRPKFLHGKPCAVFPEQRATTIHHKMGREVVFFADDWARENDIPLLIDKRYFLAVSMDGHTFIENNPERAKEKSFSLNRLSNG
jgi:hypothetical protein